MKSIIRNNRHGVLKHNFRKHKHSVNTVSKSVKELRNKPISTFAKEHSSNKHAPIRGLGKGISKHINKMSERLNESLKKKGEKLQADLTRPENLKEEKNINYTYVLGGILTAAALYKITKK